VERDYYCNNFNAIGSFNYTQHPIKPPTPKRPLNLERHKEHYFYCPECLSLRHGEESASTIGVFRENGWQKGMEDLLETECPEHCKDAFVAGMS
jgi:hypothetical protein